MTITTSLVWGPGLEFGIQVIDEQHRTFIGMINELSSLIDGDGSRQAFDNLIERLFAYAGMHFDTEEKYFHDFNYELAAEHIAEHDIMRDRLRIFRRDFQKSGREIAGELFFFTVEWLSDHLVKQDRKYVSCFKAHGL